VSASAIKVLADHNLSRLLINGCATDFCANTALRAAPVVISSTSSDGEILPDIS